MNITIIGNKGFDTLEYHLADSCKFLDHQVTIVDLDDVIPVNYSINYHTIKYFIKYNEWIFSKIAKKVIALKPDLVIGTYRFIHPNCIKNIKTALPSIPVIHINPDAITTFERQQLFAAPYDFYFTKDQFIVDFMRNKMKLNAHYLPEAFNCRVHKPSESDRKLLEDRIAIDVTTFGTMYPYRARMVKTLIDQGIRVDLFGVPDRRFAIPEISSRFRNEYITGERKCEIVNGAKIVFNNFHYAEIESVNVKFFEIFGIGGFQICDYRPSIEEYSVVDPSLFTYKTIDEAVELINYYLPRQEERHSIAKKQMEHFRTHHTYEHRMEQIFKLVLG